MELLSWLRDNGPRNGRGAARRPLRLGALEELESREVPAIVLGVGGALTLTGTDGADQIEVNRSAAGGVLVRVNAQTANFLPGQVKSVSVNAGAGNDVIVVLATEPGVGATVDAGAGDDAVQMTLSRPGQIDALGAMSSVQGSDGNDRLDFYDLSNSAHTSYSVSSSLVTRTRGSATANVSYSGSESVMVRGGSAGNSYAVTSTDKNTSLDLIGGGANDTFKIGAGTMGAIAGPVQVIGLDGSDQITFEDTANTTAADYAVEQGPLGRVLLTRRDGPALATVTYEAEKAIVAAGRGADRIVVDALPAGTTVLFAGREGDDRVEVGGGAQNLALVRGTVRVLAGDGNDTLVVDDSLNGNPESSYYIDSGAVSRNSAGQGTNVYFAELEDVQVRGSGGRNDFDIDGTPQGAVTRLFGGADDDQFHLGPSFESLVGLKGRLELTGGGGDDRAVINDVANVESSPIYQITSTELHRYGAQPVQFTDVDLAELSGPDHGTYEILSTAATMRWHLLSGEGADEFRFAHFGNGLDAIAGQVDIDDFGGYDKVFLYDSTNAADAVYSLDADGLSRTTQVATRINLHGHEELNIYAGTGNDRLEVAGPTPVPVNFGGGAGTDAVGGSDATDDFFFVTSAGGGFISVPGRTTSSSRRPKPCAGAGATTSSGSPSSGRSRASLRVARAATPSITRRATPP